MAFTLDIIKPGEGSASRYSMEDGTYIIGRGQACPIQLPYPDVSERHALLLLRDGSASLQETVRPLTTPWHFARTPLCR